MKYTAVYRSWLLSVALEAPPAALGSWLRIAAYAAELECGEPGTEVGEARLAGAKSWGERTWLRAAGVDCSELAEVVKAGLARWDGDDLIVGGYDSDGHRVVQAKRAAGKHGSKGGRPRKNPEGKTQRVSDSKPTGETHDITPLPTYPTYLPTPPDAPARDAPPAALLEQERAWGQLAAVYREETGRKDLGTLPVDWTPEQRTHLRTICERCDGPDDLRKQLRALLGERGSSNWRFMRRQPLRGWAERLGVPTDEPTPQEPDNLPPRADWAPHPLLAQGDS